MQQDQIWIAAAWLTLSAFLLLAALHLAFTGRSFELRTMMRLGRRSHPSALGVESALAVVACMIFGVVLFTLAEAQPLPLRLGFAAAGSTVLFTGAWWFFSWLRDISDAQTELLRVWRKRAFQAGERLRIQLDERTLRSELCRLTADALEATMVAVYCPDGEESWTCGASVVSTHVGQPPALHGIDLSALDPFRPHLSRRNPGLGLFPVPVSAEHADWLAVTLLHGAEFRPEIRTFVEHCALQAGAALASAQSAREYASQQSELMVRQREQQLWGKAMARLVPPDLPDIAGLDYGAEYWRGQSPEGQFIDLISLPKGALGVVLAEVGSAGMEAAVQIAQLQVLLRSRFHAYAEDLAELLQSTERALLASSEQPFPVRLFCARYLSSTRTLTYVNAGAVPPLILRRTSEGAQVLRLPGASLAMAAAPPTPFRISEMVLQTGDLVAVASLSLLHDPASDPTTPLNDSRLADSLMSWENRRASDLVRLVFRTVEEGAPQPAVDRALILLKPT
ncbi:MAG TPA: SpoIIE family protein phosphatase [Bryobacteraceae bacterium]|nr:SpoIIE family protein phosphatase [Bryobacteraceae bacterium]